MMNTFTLHHPSPIGLLTLTASPHSLTSLTFGDEAAPPEGPAPNDILLEANKQLQQYFEGNRKNFELPLSQDGTPFQQKVWELLQAIPFGKTVSYAELAKRYGDLKAIRAIATANGKNHLPLVIPCHRVIGSDHSLTGFSGGLWRKRWLLEHEARLHSGVQRLF